LDEILTCERELAVSDYFNAISGKLGEKIIAEKLAELKRCDLEIEEAHYVSTLNSKVNI
jgi:antirestriction protein